jgi:hypothetical protein
MRKLIHAKTNPRQSRLAPGLIYVKATQSCNLLTISYSGILQIKASSEKLNSSRYNGGISKKRVETETAAVLSPETAAPQRRDAAANDPDGKYANAPIDQAAERIYLPNFPGEAPVNRLETLVAATGSWPNNQANSRCPHCAWH